MTLEDSPLPAHGDPQPQARAWVRFRRSKSAWIGGALVCVFMLMALTARFVAPYEPDQVRIEQGERFPLYAPPSTRFLLGTDQDGKDLLSRVMYGSRLSLTAGMISILMSVVVGVPLGAVAGYSGRWIDTLIMRSIDVALAFPSVLLALLVAMAFRAGWEAVIIAVGLINIPVFARQVRATVLTIRGLDYVMASRSLGASHWHVLTRAILPGIINPVVVLATLGLGTAILEVAALSFLGVAGDVTEPEWGSMLTQANESLHRSIWPALGPGVAISLSILGFNLLGDGLRDALDPKLQDGR